MPLINCPECGKQVSSQAKRCIDCGYPINESQEIRPQKKESGKLRIVVISAISLFVVFILFRGCFSEDEKLTAANKEKIIGHWVSDYKEYNLLKLNPNSELDIILGFAIESSYFEDGTYESKGFAKYELPEIFDSRTIVNLDVFDEGTYEVSENTLTEEITNGYARPADEDTKYLLNNSLSSFKDELLDPGIGEKWDYKILVLDNTNMVLETKLPELDVEIKFILRKE